MIFLAAAAMGGPPVPGVDLAPFHHLRAEAPGTRLGAAVAQAGDVDGDGRPDWIVGEPLADGGGLAAGRVLVVSGRSRRVLHRIDGAAGSFLGTAVAGIGDADGDGRGDFAVGSPQGPEPGGRVTAYSGRTGHVLWSHAGAAAGDRFGRALANVGDADGDGIEDVAVGAPYHDGGGLNAGEVRLLSGRSGVLLRSWQGGPFDLLGHAVAAAGDVDGDGHGDVLVGAPLSDGVAFNGGSARVLSGADGLTLRIWHGGGVGDQLGTGVAFGGDVDGDGVPDALVGVPGADGGGIDAGAVHAYSGRTGDRLHAIPGQGEGEGAWPCAGVGDVDADGHDDFLVGAPSASSSGAQSGRVRLVSGASGLELAVVDGQRPLDWFGASLASLGDLNGDGRPEVACGAPVHDDHPELASYVRILTVR